MPTGSIPYNLGIKALADGHEEVGQSFNHPADALAMARFSLLAAFAACAAPLAASLSSQPYTWKNVKIGGGGGFVPSIVFNPSQKGLAYARTDIGGVYKLNSDDSWTPLLDFVDNARWDYWGTDALASDPVDPTRLYVVRTPLFRITYHIYHLCRPPA